MYRWNMLLALSWPLLAVWMTCTAAQAVRPAVPRTFVKLETNQFPTYAGPCSKATTTFKVPSDKYPTIPAALAAAKPFTRIVVAPGVYDFSPMWDLPGVDIQVNDLCLTGAGPRKTRFVTSNAAKGVLINSDRVAVSGFSVEGFMQGIHLGRWDRSTQYNITIRNVVIVGRSNSFAGGLHAYGDNRNSGKPVLDGLLLSKVTVSNVIMGVSCDFGPCWHWWLEDVSITCRPGEGWGADAFAIESGRQIVATGITVAKATSDGIDIKAYDAVVTKCKVLDVGSNGIKLWAGGDVMDCVINGTGDYREAIAGTPVGRYRFQRVFITNHCKNGRSYLATWGYKTNQPTARIEFRNCTFRGNPNSGGFYMPDKTPLQLVNNVFWDVGTRLLQYGEDSLNLMVDAEGVAELEQRGLGSGNKLGGV